MIFNIISFKIISNNSLFLSLRLYETLISNQDCQQFYGITISPDQYNKIIQSIHCKFHEEWLRNYLNADTADTLMIVPGSLPSSANYPLSVITSENIKDHLESIIEALTTVLEEYSKKIVYTPFLKDNSISSKDVQEPISDNITLKDNPQDREMPTPLTKEEKLKSMLKENWQKILNSSTIPKPIVNVSNERENITSHINEIILVYRNSYSNEISDLIKRYKKLSEDYNLFIRINEGLLLYSSLEKHDCFYNDKAPSSTKYGRIESIQKTETESIITFSNEAKKIIIKNKNNEEVTNLLDELIKDHREQSNLRKIESLEQKLINNLDENSYSELIKLKSQLNSD